MVIQLSGILFTLESARSYAFIKAIIPFIKRIITVDLAGASGVPVTAGAAAGSTAGTGAASSSFIDNMILF
jgi:hypothetical protein